MAVSCDFLKESLSKQSILVVGDGNFSFSASLAEYAISYGSETSLVFTSFDSAEKLLKDDLAKENLSKLSRMENDVTVLHGVDATNLSHWFPGEKFNRIIFNFPHTGGKSNIKKCRKLLEDFFKSSVQHLQPAGGDVCVTLCKGQGGTCHEQVHRSHGNSWQVVDNAAKAGLMLNRLLPFVSSHYIHYKSVGYRSRLKQSFHTKDALIHVFIPGVKIYPVEDLREKNQQVVMDSILSEVCQLGSRVMAYGRPINLLKKELYNMMKDMKENPTLIPYSQITVPNINFVNADYLRHYFQETALDIKSEYSLIRTVPNKTILTTMVEQGSVVQGYTYLSIPNAVTPSSCLISNNLIIGKLFQHTTDSYRQAEQELQDIMCCLRKMLPHDVLKVKAYTKENVTMSLRWVNSSDVAHLARKQFQDTLSNGSIDSVCNCRQLQEAFLRNDNRIQAEQFIFQELVVPHTLQIEETSHNLKVFQYGHVSPDILRQHGTSNSDRYGWIVNVDLNLLALLRYNISDIRLLWSKTVEMVPSISENSQIEDHGNVPELISIPQCLFPPSYIHDISFWVSSDVSQQQFILVLTALTRDCIKEVTLTEIYHDENNHRLSFNYRMVYCRVDGPLSHLEAVELQNNLRRCLMTLNFGLK